MDESESASGLMSQIGSTALTDAAPSTNALAHFGVKGMKWGVRRADIPGSSSQKDAVAKAAAPGHLGKTYTRNTLKRAIDSGDISSLNNSSKYKGQDLNANRSLRKSYHKDVTAILQKRETRSDKIWRHMSVVNDIAFYTTVDQLTHADQPPNPEDVVAFKLNELGQIVGVSSRTPLMKHAEALLEDDSIAHFGIKGMKWGIRRERGPGGTVGSGLSHISDEELRRIVSRMQLEQQFASLAPKPKQGVGKTVLKFAGKLLLDIGQEHITTVSRTVATTRLADQFDKAGKNVIAEQIRLKSLKGYKMPNADGGNKSKKDKKK